MNLSNKELIIFDLDGTLINSIPDLTLAVNKVLEKYDLPILTVEQTTPFVGNGPRPLAQRALNHAMGSNEISEDLFEEALASFHLAYSQNTCLETYLYPGVFETLKTLHDRGYKMVICTNKPFEYIEPILDQLEIESFFENWIGEDSLAEKKPSGQPLIHLANKTNVAISKSVMVGDSKNDILAAQNAKMQSVGLTYGYNYNEHIQDYGPDKVLNQFSELMELLK